MNIQTPLFDICSHNHKGNAASITANELVEPSKQAMKEKIIDLAKSHGRKTWVKQVIAELGYKHQTASARLSELKKAGIFVETNERRERCTVLALAE